MHLFLRQGYFTDGEVSRARLDLLNAFLAAKRQVAGFFLLNSSVQATNRGPATLEPDPARLIRLWADTAATKANRKPAIVGTVRHKANALFWDSIEPPFPIDISSQTPIAVNTMNLLVGPTSAGCSAGGVTVSSRNGTGEGSFPKMESSLQVAI